MKAEQRFLFSAGCLLASTGATKLFSAFGTARYLQTGDPVLLAPTRYILLGTAILEFGVAATCFFSKRPRVAAALTAWLACVFGAYRVALWFSNWRQPCRCIGSLPDSLHLSPQTVDNLMKVMLAYLLVGSCLVLWKTGKAGKAQP